MRCFHAVTAAALAALLAATSVLACATRARLLSTAAGVAATQPARSMSSDWSRVEAVRVGTPIRVRLYEHEAQQSDLVTIRGRFHSATADTLTLTLNELGSPTRTVEK